MTALLLLSLAMADRAGIVLTGANPTAPHIVLISGDEEYRSEEVLSQLARILNKHHGYKCTVLFALDTDGTINPNKSNIPGLAALKTADLMCIFTRFRNLPDDQMQHIDEYVESRKPIIGLRTATHAFSIPEKSRYARYHWQSKIPGWEGGFGRTILGETWVDHHGRHGVQGTRGRIAKDVKHPILTGISDGSMFGTTDVYTAHPPKDVTVLVQGEVTESLKPESKAVAGKKNDPMMPIAWTREADNRRVFTTTFGSAADLESEGVRRLLVNAVYWCLNQTVPESSTVDIVGKYTPSAYGFKKSDEWKQAKKRPADFFQ